MLVITRLNARDLLKAELGHCYQLPGSNSRSPLVLGLVVIVRATIVLFVKGNFVIGRIVIGPIVIGPIVIG